MVISGVIATYATFSKSGSVHQKEQSLVEIQGFYNYSYKCIRVCPIVTWIDDMELM